MLEIKHLTKRYKDVIAVEDVNLKIETGEIGILLGPNGAGKSTTIKCIAGLLRFEGEIDICGMGNKTLEAKRIFGYVPETPAVYDSLTVEEHMNFIMKAYKLDDSYLEYGETLLKRLDLDDKRKKLGKELSKGMQQKVSLLCALIIKPKVILLDEPLIGLDPKAIKELKDILAELKAEGASILISTHIIESVLDLYDRVIILNKGKTIWESTKKESGSDVEKIFLQVTGKGEDTAS